LAGALIPSREVMLERIQQLPQQKWWPDAVQLALRGALAIFVAYVAASSIMTIFALGPLVSMATGMVARPKAAGSAPSLGISSINYREVKKGIIERNLFNSEGQYPKEELERAAGSADGRPVFDINAPCQACTLNIELVGTIYLGSREKSLATVKEKGLSDADVYRVGDVIIGSDDAIIAAVERNELIINNKGIKECLSLKSDLEKQIETGEAISGMPAGAGGGGDQLPPVLVDGPYVESELGAGFGKIINAARLVPNLADSQMNGFKIFAIDPSSLFSKVGLQNGDIITQVNDVSLKNPDQGFALYEAFRNEREVRISVLRNGTTPQMITVRIK
jgi:general secretion pathway protein C